MKASYFTSIFLVLILALQVNAGFLIPNLLAYKDNLINLIKEKNVEYVFITTN